jgi:steroid delta-isomerase-like uncharacterized protein
MASVDAKTLARRFFEEVWNQGNLDVLDVIIASDYDPHPLPNDPDFGRGPAGQKQFVNQYRLAFPDTHFTVEAQLAEGDVVATRWTAHGTHTGDLMGIPASQQPVTVTGITINRIANGKLSEGGANFDQLSLLQQIGAIPAQRQAGA